LECLLKLTMRQTNEGLIEAYIHPGGKVGVLIEVDCETDFVANTEDFRNLCKELCLQIAAMSPRWIKTEDIPQEEIEKEKDIYRKQMEGTKKPPHILDKIIEGKLKSFYQEVCLLEQNWIRDEKKKISSLVDENIIIRRFVRFQIGEE